jgi:membrane fusion protein (multidrug efflux system)
MAPGVVLLMFHQRSTPHMRPKKEADLADSPVHPLDAPHAAEPAQRAEPPVPRAVPQPEAAEPAPAAERPAPVPPASPQRPRRLGGNRGARLLLVLLLIVGAGMGYGGYWWLFLRGTVSTDDAYVEARIVSVASRLSERVDAVLVGEGHAVQQGQPLARFADDKLRISVNEARAQVRSAEAALNEARNSPRPEQVEVARAEVRVREVELELQQNEWTRAQQLVKVRAISAQEFERRRSAVATARSQLEVSRRQLSLLQAGSSADQIDRAEAALELARTQLQAARADAGDSELRSPVTGIVAKQMVDTGEVVQKGQALFQIVETAKSWVVANLEEDEIAAIHEGQPVRIWVDAYPGRQFEGRVGPLYAATLSRFSLLPSASASGSFIKVTQRVPVRIDWEGQDLPPMYPGLNVVVRILVD